MGDENLARRDVVKGFVGAAVGTTVTAAPIRAAAAARMRYVSVGVGSRSRMYQDAVWGPHRATAELVGVCDINPGRLNYVAQRAEAAGVAAPKPYLAADFDSMLRDLKPDGVIVTTPDALHDDYLVRALDAGFDVITEKPMTTTAAKAQRILDAARRNDKRIRVTFNYRYSPFRSQIKELLSSGLIGEVLSVDFHWLLNTLHGADYFRRWHSSKAISGGLMVHKATHHFDLVNWWLSDMPTEVSAMGKRDFYTPDMARRLGLEGPHERCLTCPEGNKCSFKLDLRADKGLKALYLDNERYDGYYRDRCVWRPEIDIEDTMNVAVRYSRGTTLSYSLNAFNAWEGYHVAFNGTKGRLEHSVVEQSAGTAGAGGPEEADLVTTRFIPLRGAPRSIEPWTGSGGHGGGDAVMLAEIFDPSAPADPLLRAADQRSGAASILVGVAANRCFETGAPVKIAELVSGLEWPDYPPMPTRKDRVPMPVRGRQV